MTIRVEYRRSGKKQVLAILNDAKPHYTTLDPFFARLLHEGKQGSVVLVNDLTGTIIAGRHLPRRGTL